MNDQRWTKLTTTSRSRARRRGQRRGDRSDRHGECDEVREKDTSRTIQVDTERNNELNSTDLTVSDIKHPGFNATVGENEGEAPESGVPLTLESCASGAGPLARSVSAPACTGEMLKPSQTMLCAATGSCRCCAGATALRRFRRSS